MHVIRGNRVERALGHIGRKKDREERSLGGVLTPGPIMLSCLLYGPTVHGNFICIF